MSKQISIAEARNRFTTLVHEVEQSTMVELTRRGKPVAVLMSIDEYQRLTPKQAGFWEMYQAFQHQTNLFELNIEPELFAEARDTSPGREVSW